MQQRSVEDLPRAERQLNEEAARFARDAKARVDAVADQTAKEAEQRRIADLLKQKRQVDFDERYRKAADQIRQSKPDRSNLNTTNAEPLFKVYYEWVNSLNEGAFTPTGSSRSFFTGLQQAGVPTYEQMIGMLPIFEDFMLPGQEMRFSANPLPTTPLEKRLDELAANNHAAYNLVEQILGRVINNDAAAQEFGLASRDQLSAKMQIFREIVNRIQRRQNQEESAREGDEYETKLNALKRALMARPGSVEDNSRDVRDLQTYLDLGKNRASDQLYPDANERFHDPDTFEQHIRDILATINTPGDEMAQLFRTAELMRASHRQMEEDPRRDQARTESVSQLLRELKIDRIRDILLEGDGTIRATGEVELNDKIEKSLLTLMQKAFDNPEKAFDESFNQLVEAADVGTLVERIYLLSERVMNVDHLPNVSADVRARLRAILVESAKRSSALVDMARLMHNIPFVFRKAPEDKWAQYIGSVSVSKFALLTKDPATKEAMKYFNQFLYQVVVVENNNTIPPDLFSEMFYEVGYGGAGNQTQYGNPFFDRFKDGLKSILKSSDIQYDDVKLNWLTHCVFLNFVTGDATRILANSKARTDWKAKPFARFLFAHKPGEHGVNIGLEGGLDLLKNRLHFVMKMPMSQLADYEKAYGEKGWTPSDHRAEVDEWVDHKISAERPDEYADMITKDIDNHWYRFWGVINKIGMWTYFDQGGFRLGGVEKEYMDTHGGKTPSEDWKQFYQWCVRGAGPGITNGFYFAGNIAKSQARDMFLKSGDGKKDVDAAAKKNKATAGATATAGLYADSAFDSAVSNVSKKPLEVRLLMPDGSYEVKNMCLEEYIMLRTRGVRAESMYMAMLKDPVSFMSAITQMEPELASGEAGGMEASKFFFDDIDVRALSAEDRQKRNTFRAYAMINFRRENLKHLKFIAQTYEKAYDHTFADPKANVSNGTKWAKVSELLSVAQTRARNSGENRFHMTEQDILGNNPTDDERFVANLMFGSGGMINHFSELGGGRDLAAMEQRFGDGASVLGETNNFFMRWAQAHYEVNGLNFSPMLLDNDPDQMIRKLVVSGPNAIERQFEIYAEVPKILDDILKPYGYMKELADTRDIKGIMELVTKKNKKMETIYDKDKMYINNFFNLYLLGQDFRLADSTRLPILGMLNEWDLGYQRSLASGDYQNLNQVTWTDDTLIALAQYFAVFSYIGKRGLWSAPMLLNAWGLHGKTVDDIRNHYIQHEVLPSVIGIGLAAYMYFAIKKAADEKDLEDKR